MVQITKEDAAKIMGCGVRTFQKKYSALLSDIGLGATKLFDLAEVEALKDSIIQTRKAKA